MNSTQLFATVFAVILLAACIIAVNTVVDWAEAHPFAAGFITGVAGILLVALVVLLAGSWVKKLKHRISSK